MEIYTFRLDDSTSQEFKGVVAVFMTSPQQIWRRLKTDNSARQTDQPVASNETEKLRRELEAVTEGTQIPRGPTLLWQLLGDDPLVNDGYQLTFVGRSTFPMLAPSEASFRSNVEFIYQKLLSSNVQV
jgi:hypothetical protein